MNTANEKTTLYLDPRVKRGVQFYALRDRRSLSDIVNEKLLEFLEDMADVATIEARKDEPTVGFAEVAKELGFSVDDLRSKAKEERSQRTKKAKQADC